MAGRAEVPAWLSERYPLRDWQTLRKCSLRVDADAGAGLEMEEGDFGYLVEEIAEKPGQDVVLQPRDVIVAVAGERLLGLPGDRLASTFGAHFEDGVEVLLASHDELREAQIERESNEECPCEEPGDEDQAPVEASANYELLRRAPSSTEYPATVRIPVSRTAVWSMDEATKRQFDQDLGMCGGKFGISAVAQFDKFGNMERVVLNGVSSAIAAARAEVVQILDFYRNAQHWRPDGDVAAGGRAGGAPPAQQGDADAGASLFKVPPRVRDLRQFKYHDHTADIIVHSWGNTQEEAFAQVVVGMFNYMTPIDQVDFEDTVDVEATGHDMLDLLYHLLDEFLFVFSTEMHVSRIVEILSFDEKNFKIRARGYGEKMDLKKHEQGTEIKAITMHMMRILEPDTVLSENGTVRRIERDETEEGQPYEVYVLLDI